MAATFGEVAHDAFESAAASASGRDRGPWDWLSPPARECWQAAADAVVEAVEERHG